MMQRYIEDSRYTNKLEEMTKNRLRDVRNDILPVICQKVENDNVSVNINRSFVLESPINSSAGKIFFIPK